MARSIHYEIFARQGAKGGWTLADVRNDREAALAAAQAMMAEQRATGVKVVKETYHDDTGDYLSLKIFEDGHNQLKMKAAEEDVPHALPCFKPDDLYSYHARATIARLIPDFLARNRITVTELGHRADMLEKLEATGTLLQHAIQKVAVAQASSTSASVTQIIKNLNELTEKTMNRVYRDQRKGVFPAIPAEEFGALASQLSGKPESGYLLNGALALHLKESSGWDDKVGRLIALMPEGDDGTLGTATLLGAIDSLLAEVLSGSAALHELLGARDNLGQALMTLVGLFLGQPEAGEAESGLAALRGHFANDQLPAARTAVADRILAEFRGPRRLCPDSLEDEFRTLRKIANRLVAGVGKYLSHEDLISAFTLRSRRLVTHETIGQHLAAAATPDEKLERLLFVEENIIGTENKRQLATFMTPVVTAPSFESFFLNPKPVTAPLARMQRLAQLQGRVGRSALPEIFRRDMADLLDRIAADVESRNAVFDAIDRRSANTVEKAQTVLALALGGTLTEGRVSTRARQQVIGYLGRPGFLSAYIAQTAAPGEGRADVAMAELLKTLGKAGIAAEQGLKSIAA